MKLAHHGKGFLLIELAIAVGIAALLITAVTQLVIAASSSYQLQQNLGALQENARFALNTMQSEIEAAGYQSRPWLESQATWAVASQDAVTAKSDRIRVRRWSDTNCFENLNTALDEDGSARFFLRETSFVVSSSGNLSLSCKYGPDTGQLITQINNLGLVENAESLQALYAEDSDADGNPDRWITAGLWSDEANVLAIRLALLLATPDPVNRNIGGPIQVLDHVIEPRKDGRLRRVFYQLAAIRSRGH